MQLHDAPLLERRRRAELTRIARERRAALAYCIECRNPLLATDQGFQYCPYERAGQHAKVKRAIRRTAVDRRWSACHASGGARPPRARARNDRGRHRSELAMRRRLATMKPLPHEVLKPCLSHASAETHVCSRGRSGHGGHGRSADARTAYDERSPPRTRGRLSASVPRDQTDQEPTASSHKPAHAAIAASMAAPELLTASVLLMVSRRESRATRIRGPEPNPLLVLLQISSQTSCGMPRDAGGGGSLKRASSPRARIRRHFPISFTGQARSKRLRLFNSRRPTPMFRKQGQPSRDRVCDSTLAVASAYPRRTTGSGVDRLGGSGPPNK